MRVNMRITTGMINAEAAKAGIVTTGTSMLSYLNKDASEDMVNALTALSNSKKTAKASATIISTYTDVKKNAEGLTDSLAAFTNEDKNLLAKAKETGDTSALVSAAKNFAESYNKVYKKMAGSSTALDQFYASSLKEAVSSSSEAFAAIGISLDKDGALSVDSDKLKSASAEDFEKVFGESSNFMKMGSYISARIEKNAQANLDSVNSTYDPNGSYSTSESTSGNYDFFG